MNSIFRGRRQAISFFTIVILWLSTCALAFADELDISIQDGLRVVSDNGANRFLLGAYILIDTIALDSHPERPPRFDLFNAWIFLAGKIERHYHYKIQYSLDDSSSNKIRDAWAGIQLGDRLLLKLGHFDAPAQAEHVSALSYTPLAGRSMADNLTHGRDVGVMLEGQTAGERLYYAIGVFNGNGIDKNSEENAAKDFGFRLTGQLVGSPKRLTGIRLYPDISFIGGKQKFESVRLKNETGTTFFSMSALTISERYRYSAALYGMFNSFSTRFEYLINQYRFVEQESMSTIRAFSVLFSFFLTGEKEQYKAGLFRKVKASDTWQLVLRFSNVELGNGFIHHSLVDVSPGDVRDSSRASAVSGGVNWFPVSNVKYNLSLIDTIYRKLPGSVLSGSEYSLIFRATLQYF